MHLVSYLYFPPQLDVRSNGHTIRDLNPSHFGTRYEYTDCDVQDHFATLGCTQCDASTDFCTNVPSSYLGGYLLNSLADGSQYVYCDDGHTLINTN